MRVAYDARVRDWVRPRGAGCESGRGAGGGISRGTGLGAFAGAALGAERVLRWVRVRSHGAFPKAQDTGTFLMTGARAGACVRSL